jgi:hypothetical protein
VRDILFPFPDLSLHCVTDVVVPVIVDGSAASSHNAHPGIENVDDVTTVFPLLDRSDQEVTPSAVEVIVEVSLASNHIAKFDRRDGMNRSLFTRDVDILFLLVILHS